MTVAACVLLAAERSGRSCRLSVEMGSWESRATTSDNGCREGEPLTGGVDGGRPVNRVPPVPRSSRIVEVKVRYLARKQYLKTGLYLIVFNIILYRLWCYVIEITFTLTFLPM